MSHSPPISRRQFCRPLLAYIALSGCRPQPPTVGDPTILEGYGGAKSKPTDPQLAPSLTILSPVKPAFFRRNDVIKCLIKLDFFENQGPNFVGVRLFKGTLTIDERPAPPRRQADGSYQCRCELIGPERSGIYYLEAYCSDAVEGRANAVVTSRTRLEVTVR